MARVIWKGNISFGLVNIPVRLYSATESKNDIRFNTIDKRDNARVGYKKVNKRTGEEVPKEDLGKAYKLETGQMVVMEDEDFEKANPKATKTVDIKDFVDLDDIPPQFFDKPYYLLPEPSSKKSFVLLREVIRESERAAIAKIVMRSRERLGALIPRGDLLLLNLIRFDYEIRDVEEFEAPTESLDELGVSDAELKMARQLVDGMVTDWDPERYTDEYREQLLAAIHEKAEQGDVTAVPEVPTEGEVPAEGVIDLTELLKQSVERQAS